jgi:hypothetical protein
MAKDGMLVALVAIDPSANRFFSQIFSLLWDCGPSCQEVQRDLYFIASA